MEITLNQLIDAAPELAMMLRRDIRQGKLAATRKTGVAGRPYVVESDVLAESDQEPYRLLAQKVLKSPERLQTRHNVLSRSESFGGLRTTSEEVWQPLMKMLESQHAMLQQMINVFMHEMQQSQERFERQGRDMQELSYKLGQAHQQVERLERMVGERLVRPQEQA